MTRFRTTGGSLSLVFLIVAICASGLAGCTAPADTGNVVKADSVRSDKPRLAAQPLDEAGVPQLVDGNTEFALDLYRELLDLGENVFCSPYSISVALAMTYAGARAETEQQMANALHYTLPQAELHRAFNALDQALATRGEGESEGAFRLHVANAIWGRRNHSVLDSFLDTLAQNYGAGMRVVEFGRADEARRTINQWVSDETESKIQELLPEGSIDGETELVLTNAVYFKAAWKQPFAEARTEDSGFSLLDGSAVSVPMMSQIAELGYAEGQGVQAVELPYAGDELSMVILLPEKGRFEEFAGSLNSSKIAALLQRLAPGGVALTLPRFRFESECELRSAMMALGMVDAFGDADFSGMDGTHELYIDEVYHEAQIAVDEAGTEATAATGVVMTKGGPFAEFEVTIDRPFVFLIRDIETGTILFLGHVVNPCT